jgi:hypothetical protein
VQNSKEHSKYDFSSGICLAFADVWCLVQSDKNTIENADLVYDMRSHTYLIPCYLGGRLCLRLSPFCNDHCSTSRIANIGTD